MPNCPVPNDLTQACLEQHWAGLRLRLPLRLWFQGVMPLLIPLLMAMLVGLLALAGAGVAAQTKFAITGYKIQGNTLLDPTRLGAITQAHTGPQSDFETIQQAIESLEKAYANAGFGSVKVEVPEQELESGVVTLQVVEGKLGEVVVEDNPFFDAANIRRSLPALQGGDTTNTDELNRNLVVANESGAKNTSVTFKRNAVTGLSDAVVKVTAEDPERWLALLDNTGSESTGKYRLGLVYQHANLFNRDHALSLQLMSSPGHWSQVGILGLGYRIPLYGLGGAVDLSASYSSVDSGKVSQPAGGPDLAISGGGRTFGAKYSHFLNSSALWQHRASLGLERREFGNSVTLTGVGGGSLVPDLSTTPLSVGYQGSWRDVERDFSLNLTATKNLPGLINPANGSTADFNLPGGRAGATADFSTLKYSLNFTQRWPSQWSLRAAVSGQTSQDLLIAAEQFGGGGNDSVRGYGEREIAGDQGLRIGLEVWAAPIDAAGWRLVPLAFVDGAQVSRNQPAAGEIPEQVIASAGLGLRAVWGRSMNLRVDWGHALRNTAGGTGTQAGAQRLHATLIWNFQ